MHFSQEAIGDALPKQGGKTLSRQTLDRGTWNQNIRENKAGEKGKQILQ